MKMPTVYELVFDPRNRPEAGHISPLFVGKSPEQPSPHVTGPPLPLLGSRSLIFHRCGHVPNPGQAARLPTLRAPLLPDQIEDPASLFLDGVLIYNDKQKGPEGTQFFFLKLQSYLTQTPSSGRLKGTPILHILGASLFCCLGSLEGQRDFLGVWLCKNLYHHRNLCPLCPRCPPLSPPSPETSDFMRPKLSLTTSDFYAIPPERRGDKAGPEETEAQRAIVVMLHAQLGKERRATQGPLTPARGQWARCTCLPVSPDGPLAGRPWGASGILRFTCMVHIPSQTLKKEMLSPAPCGTWPLSQTSFPVPPGSPPPGCVDSREPGLLSVCPSSQAWSGIRTCAPAITPPPQLSSQPSCVLWSQVTGHCLNVTTSESLPRAQGTNHHPELLYFSLPCGLSPAARAPQSRGHPHPLPVYAHQ